MYYGIGKTGVPGPAGAIAEILENGSVIVLTGIADMGQGATTGLAKIAADTLGIPLDYVTIITGDTAVTPDAGVTSASRSIYVVGNAVKKAVEQAMKPILIEAQYRLESSIDDLVAREGKIYPKDTSEHFVSLTDMITACKFKGIQTFAAFSFKPEFEKLDPVTGLGAPYPTYAFATQIAEVEVDTETGHVKVLKVVAAQDVGKTIDPTAVEGQIEGGIAMGLGQALLEEVKFNDTCNMVSSRFSTYLLPTVLDMCEVETILIEAEESTGPFGAKGAGEPALIPTMSAIIGAIYDATGIMISELPATPEKILTGLAQLENEGKFHSEVKELGQ